MLAVSYPSSCGRRASDFRGWAEFPAVYGLWCRQLLQRYFDCTPSHRPEDWRVLSAIGAAFSYLQANLGRTCAPAAADRNAKSGFVFRTSCCLSVAFRRLRDDWSSQSCEYRINVDQRPEIQKV